MPLSVLGSVSYSTGGFGGALTSAWANDFQKVKSLYRRDPRNPADWDALLTQLEKVEYSRAALSQQALAALKSVNAPEPAVVSAELIAQPNTFVVATGQQPGLFGGPLYNLYKALTAIKLARNLNIQYAGRATFVPLFWVASDDHDLDEIAHAEFLDPKGQLQRLKLEFGASVKGSEAQFVSARESFLPFEVSLKNLLSGPDAARLNASILDVYQKQLVGVAFVKLLTDWLGAQGLIVMEGRHARPLATELFARELEEYPKSSAAIKAGAEQQQAAGYKAEFLEEDVHPHLFVSTQGVRARLEPDGPGRLKERSSAFAARGLKAFSLTVEEWKTNARQRPEIFSANAAFRSIIQNRCIPVAAVVLGPGELNYWAQLGPLHDYYQTPWPMLVPRASFTLLDSAAQKAARKLNLSLLDLFAEKDLISKRLFAGSALEKAVDASRSKILAETETLHATVKGQDGGLDSMFEKMKKRFVHELDRAARKTRENQTNKENAGTARLDYLSAWVRPRGKPQERVIAAAQLLAQYPELNAELLELLDPLDFQHHVIGL